MDDDRPSLESRIAALERRTAELERRLAIDPRDAPANEEPVDQNPALRPPGSERSTLSWDFVPLLSLVGRAFVVVGGAYLLRAVTESGALPVSIGVALGFAYATAWLIAADRAGRSLSAAFHGTTATLIALPLLWEAATRFGAAPPPVAAAILTAIVVAALVVAVRVRLQTLAWIVLPAGLAASVALMTATGAVLPFAVADIAIGIATLWIGYTADWIGLRWPAALVADVAVMGLTAAAAAGRTPAPVRWTVTVQFLLLAAYLGSIVVRTLARGRDVIPFEIAQGAAALVIGFGGAIVVTRRAGLDERLLLALGLGCGLACYAVAFAFVARRQGLRRNFHFYTSLGLALVLAGSGLLLDHAPIVWAAVAVAAAWASRRAREFALALHTAAYVLAAALASGLLGASTAALVGPPIGQPAFAPAFVAIAGAAVACWALVATPAASWRYARLVIAGVVAWSAAGWLAAVVTSGATDPGVLATLRTAALAIAALGLASMGRSMRFHEAAWLVYPVLVAGGIKLLVEDFPRSSAATLFVALALYGAALIAAPRLLTRAP